ncbi:MAG: glycine betaine ABC transporter substrate-binding protein [Pseudomonadota bacterium]
MKKTLLAAAVMATVGTAQATEKVAISDLSWAGAKAIGHVIAAVINGPMGSEAEIVDGLSDGNLVAEGMDKGDGSADVYTDLWMPNRQVIWDKFVDGAETVGVNKPYQGTQMMYVPSYMADTVSSFEDLANPEVAAMFDNDGNGKGEYWAGAADWASSKMWQVKFKSYGLSELWEPILIPQATFLGQLKGTIAAQDPVLFYYWTPEAVHAQYDLSPLAEAGRSEGCEDLKLDQEDWLEASTFSCENKDATIYIAYSKSLEERNPAVAKMLSQVQLDPNTINGWILSIKEDGEDPADVAETWIEENPDIVNSWLN